MILTREETQETTFTPKKEVRTKLKLRFYVLKRSLAWENFHNFKMVTVLLKKIWKENVFKEVTLSFNEEHFLNS